MNHPRIPSVEAPVYRLPRAPLPQADPRAFVPLLLSWSPGIFQQWVYAQAWEQTLALHRPSLVERDLLGVWN